MRKSLVGVVVVAAAMLVVETSRATPVNGDRIIVDLISGRDSEITTIHGNNFQFGPRNVGGWDITLVGGSSKAPNSMPLGLDLELTGVSCKSVALRACEPDSLIAVGPAGLTANKDTYSVREVSFVTDGRITDTKWTHRILPLEMPPDTPKK